MLDVPISQSGDSASSVAAVQNLAGNSKGLGNAPASWTSEANVRNFLRIAIEARFHEIWQMNSGSGSSLRLFVLFVGSLLFGGLRAGPVVAADGTSAWEKIAPFFTPPAEFANQFGPYTSPLTLDDERRVKTAADWQQRRHEILRYWHKVMGPWPSLIEHPKIEYLDAKARENFTQHRVRLEIAPTQSTEGYLLVPEGKGPFPAVVVPYYEPESSIGVSKVELRDFGYQLARRGFVTLSIGSPGGDARQPATGQAVCQPLSFLAYVAANCCNALRQLPHVDPQRIGIVGHSYGGKWAMFASCLYDKFACAAWSDGGVVFDEKRSNVNYWEPWYLGNDPAHKRTAGAPTQDNPRTGAYKTLAESAHDLHELHALMAPRPFLVSGGSEDRPSRWIALNHAVAVNRLLGHTNRVALTTRKDHTPTPESNEQIYLFFEYFLKETKAQGSPAK